MSDYLSHRRNHINAGRPLPEKKKYKLKPVSDKRAKKLAEQKAAGGDNQMDLFFEEMSKRCVNKCLFCNGPTKVNFLRNDNEKWSQEANDRKWERDQEHMKRFAVAHLLPKREIDKGGFPSVGTNEDNWIELCWNCHTSFDKGKITWLMLKDSKEWDVIKEKLLVVLPLVAMEERKHKLYSTLTELVYNK